MSDKTKVIEVRGTKAIIKYEFDFNNAPALWSYKDEWVIFIQSVNGINWTKLKQAYLDDVDFAIRWHEHKGIQESAKNLLLHYEPKFYGDLEDTTDDNFQAGGSH